MKVPETSFLFSGFGGQGVMFVGQLLAYSALDADLNVTWIPSYGPEMRGGTAHCSVVISERPIGSASPLHPDVGVVFNAPSFSKYLNSIKVGGVLVVNSSLISATSTRPDCTIIRLPATEIATRLSNVRVTNIVMLGATLAQRPLISLATVEKALAAHLPPHRQDMLALNLRALYAGADYLATFAS